MVDKLSEAHERHQQLLKEIQALRTSASEEKVRTSDSSFCRSDHEVEGLPYVQSNFPQAALEESLLKTQEELSSAKGCAANLAQVENDLSDARKRIEELGTALEQRDADEVYPEATACMPVIAFGLSLSSLIPRPQYRQPSWKSAMAFDRTWNHFARASPSSKAARRHRYAIHLFCHLGMLGSTAWFQQLLTNPCLAPRYIRMGRRRRNCSRSCLEPNGWWLMP